MNPEKVFISCVSSEFKEHRGALRNALDAQRQAGPGGIEIRVFTPVVQEIMADDRAMLETLEREILPCAQVVHLWGTQSGAFPSAFEVCALLERNPRFLENHPVFVDVIAKAREEAAALKATPELPQKTTLVSYTQWEAFLALHHGKKLLSFTDKLRSDAVAGDAGYSRHWSAICAAGIHRSSFQTVDGLCLAVTTILRNKAGLSVEGGRVNPVPPPAPPQLPHRLARINEVFVGRNSFIREYGDWLKAPAAPRMLMLTGEAGTGKSAFAARLCSSRQVDPLQPLRPEEGVKAWHFCDAGEVSASGSDDLVQSLVRGFSAYVDGFAGHYELLKAAAGSSRPSPEDVFHNWVVRALEECRREGDGPVVIVVDALDEDAGAGDDDGPGEDGVVKFLLSAFATGELLVPAWIRLVVTCRNDSTAYLELKAAFVPKIVHLDPGAPENRKDIRNFIVRSISLPGGAPLDDRTVVALARKSQGVFLYAQLVGAQLRAGQLEPADLARCPNGLAGLYEEIFRRIFGFRHAKEAPFSDEARKSQLRLHELLEVLCAAVQPLHRRVISALLKEKVENVWKHQSFRTLFPEANGCLRPVHRTVVEWLALPRAQNGAGVDVQAGHRRLAELCAKALARYEASRGRSEDDLECLSLAFLAGVDHFLQCRRVGDAIGLISWLARVSGTPAAAPPRSHLELKKLLQERGAFPSSDDRARMPHRLAAWMCREENRLTTEEAAQVNAAEVADIIVNLYAEEVLQGPVRFLVEHKAEEWRGSISPQWLLRDDFVLRHTMAIVEADLACERAERNETDALIEAVARFRSCLPAANPVNTREFGTYAIARVYARFPKLINPADIALMADGELYCIRSALGDLLFKLCLGDTGQREAGFRLLRGLAKNSRFLQPVWMFNRMDVRWLGAAGECLDQPGVAALPGPEEAACMEEIITWLRVCLEEVGRLAANDADEPGALPRFEGRDEVAHAVSLWLHLGTLTSNFGLVKQPLSRLLHVDPDTFLRVVILVLGHPLWEVTEAGAEVLAELATGAKPARRMIRTLMRHDQWRVRYGAAEAAFLLRDLGPRSLFFEAVETLHAESAPLLRGNLVENLAAVIQDSSLAERKLLLTRFERPIRRWIGPEEDDAWVLDHVHRLFQMLVEAGMEDEIFALTNGEVSPLLSGTGDAAWSARAGAPVPEASRVWYQLPRSELLVRMEALRIEQVNQTNASG